MSVAKTNLRWFFLIDLPVQIFRTNLLNWFTRSKTCSKTYGNIIKFTKLQMYPLLVNIVYITNDQSFIYKHALIDLCLWLGFLHNVPTLWRLCVYSTHALTTRPVQRSAFRNKDWSLSCKTKTTNNLLSHDAGHRQRCCRSHNAMLN